MPFTTHVVWYRHGPSFQWKHMHERNFIGPYSKRSQSSKSRKVRRYGFILVSYLTALSPVHSYERWKECWRISFPFGHNHRLNKYLQVGAKATVAHRNMSTCLFKIPDLLRQEIRRNFRNFEPTCINSFSQGSSQLNPFENFGYKCFPSHHYGC